MDSRMRHSGFRNGGIRLRDPAMTFSNLRAPLSNCIFLLDAYVRLSRLVQVALDVLCPQGSKARAAHCGLLLKFAVRMRFAKAVQDFLTHGKSLVGTY